MHYIQSVFNKGNWGGNKNIEISIYCPDQIANDWNKYWKLHLPDIVEATYPFPRLTFCPMSSESRHYKIGDGFLSARKVYHAFGKIDALAFRFKTPKGIFVYSGDTGDCSGIREITKDADIFVSECTAPISEISPSKYGHLNPQVVGDIAKNSGVKRLVLFHYIGLDSDEAIVNEIRRAGFKGEVIVGKDFQKIEV